MHPSKEGSRDLTRLQAWCLYSIHFLFSWNVRSYEFSAIIFTASVYPDNLTAASIRGVSQTVAAIFLSSLVGRWIDHSPSRLRTLATTIWAHRASILMAYIFWLFLVDDAKAGAGRGHVEGDLTQGLNSTTAQGEPDALYPDLEPGTSRIFQNVLFAIILALGVVVRLSGIANDLSIDREWLPVLAPSSASSSPTTSLYDLTHLNAVLRRIDLICKILTPLLVTMFVKVVNSYRWCIISLGLLTIVSCAAELWCARWMYRASSALRTPKTLEEEAMVEVIDLGDSASNFVYRILMRGRSLALDQVNCLIQYFSTVVWIPATAQALQHLTVLAYSASLITYLLEIGFSLTVITSARACGSIIEVGSTILCPWAIHYFSRKHIKREAQRDEAETEGFLNQEEPTKPDIDSTVLEKVGFFGIWWQFCNLIPVAVALFLLSGRSYVTASKPKTPVSLSVSIVLLLFLSLSRAGLWTYDLTTTELSQSLVPSTQLSSFAGTQQAFQSTFEMTHWIVTARWGNTHQFRWLALGSLGAIGTAATSYALWVMKGEARRNGYKRVEGEELQPESPVEERQPESPREARDGYHHIQ